MLIKLEVKKEAQPCFMKQLEKFSQKYRKIDKLMECQDAVAYNPSDSISI